MLLAVFIYLDTIYLLFGDGSVKMWRVFYYLNQAFLIIGTLSILRGYFDTFLVDIVIGLSFLRVVFNFIFAIDEKFAEKINTCYWAGLLIVVVIISLLINKWLRKK
jgi:uncharacterized membrane protein